MNAQTQLVEGEVLDNMPTAQHATGTALAQANPYLSLVETMVARGGDLSNLDKMLDLQIKWEANEARKAYVAAMAAFKAEPMEILKRKLVSFTTRDGDTTSYKHAELSDVTDAVVPAMGKHGLSHRWDIQQQGGGITVTCTITHALGHSEAVSMTAAPDASGKKNAIQQVASTTTYLQRYTLLAATGMATKGMDDDGAEYEEEEEEDQRDADWIRTANQMEHPQDYQKHREKMLADYGGVDNVPRPVKVAFANALARVTPKDEA
jgi:hypothetical protein